MRQESDMIRPPLDPHQALIVMFYEFHKYIRSARMVGILALGALIVAIIMLVPPVLGQPYPEDPANFAQRFIAWVNMLVVVGAALFASDSLASEFQDRTGYLLFPQPVKRRVLFAGKMAASLTAMFLLILAFYAVVAALTLWKYGTVPHLMLYSGALALMYVTTATGIGFLVSSFMRGTAGALVLTASVLLLIMPILDTVLSVAQVKPVLSPTFSGGAISLVMQTPYPVDTMVEPLLSSGPAMSSVDLVPIRLYYPTLRMSAAVMLGWAFVTTVAALILFGRREMRA